MLDTAFERSDVVDRLISVDFHDDVLPGAKRAYMCRNTFCRAAAANCDGLNAVGTYICVTLLENRNESGITPTMEYGSPFNWPSCLRSAGPARTPRASMLPSLRRAQARGQECTPQKNRAHR
jgi:hypothetical protein